MAATEEINRKMEELKTYIPFVDRMISKLESKQDADKEQNLSRLKGLSRFLNNPDPRLRNLDTLQRMEKIIKGMYRSAGKKIESNSDGLEIADNDAKKSSSRGSLLALPMPPVRDDLKERSCNIWESTSSESSSTHKNITSSFNTLAIKPTDTPMASYPNIPPDTPDSPDNLPPTSNSEIPVPVKCIPLDRKDASSGHLPLPQVNAEAIQKALNFINAHDSTSKHEQTQAISYRYEDFVGPATSWGASEVISNSLGRMDIDLRAKKDVDLRQIPGTYSHPSFINTNAVASRGSSVPAETDILPSSQFPSPYESGKTKDVDMRTFIPGLSHSSDHPKSAMPTTSSDPKGVIQEVNKSDSSVRMRVIQGQDKLIKLGQKGVAASQLESYKQKREKFATSSTYPIKSAKTAITASASIKDTAAGKLKEGITILDELLPDTDEKKTRETGALSLPDPPRGTPLPSRNQNRSVTKLEAFQNDPSKTGVVKAKTSHFTSRVNSNDQKPGVVRSQDPRLSDSSSQVSTDKSHMSGVTAFTAPNTAPNIQRRDPRLNSFNASGYPGDPRAKATSTVFGIAAARDLRTQPQIQSSYKDPRLQPQPIHNFQYQSQLLNRFETPNWSINSPPPPGLLPVPFGARFQGSRFGPPRPPLIGNRPPAFPPTQNQFYIPQTPVNSPIGETFTCLIMKGLPYDANSSHIYKYFENYILRDLCIELDESYNCKGTAYVHFPNHTIAKEVLDKENGRFINHHKIFLGICSVGILKQAKKEYEMQNFDREKYLNIPSRPTGNGNPFYKPKPRVEPPSVPEKKEDVVASTPPEGIAEGDATATGYSKLCGVKIDVQGSKSLQTFKIPKLKKTEADELSQAQTESLSKSSSSNQTLSSELPSKLPLSPNTSSNVLTPETPLKLLISPNSPPFEIDSGNTDNDSDSNELIELAPQTKKNRRYLKIISSDSESDLDTDDKKAKNSCRITKKSTRSSPTSPVKNKRLLSPEPDSDEEMGSDESEVVNGSFLKVGSEDVDSKTFPQADRKPKSFPTLEMERGSVSEGKTVGVPGRKRGRKRKNVCKVSDLEETKLTRQKSEVFKEIFAAQKKLRVIIPVPVAYAYSLINEDKPIKVKRERKSSGFPVTTPTPKQIVTELASSFMSENEYLEDFLSLTQEEEEFGDLIVEEVKSKKPKRDFIPFSRKRKRRVKNKWQKGYLKNWTSASKIRKISPDSASMIRKSPDSASIIRKSPDSASMIRKSPDSASIIRKSPDSASIIRKSPDSASMIMKISPNSAEVSIDGKTEEIEKVGNENLPIEISDSSLYVGSGNVGDPIVLNDTSSACSIESSDEAETIKSDSLDMLDQIESNLKSSDKTLQKDLVSASSSMDRTLFDSDLDLIDLTNVTPNIGKAMDTLYNSLPEPSSLADVLEPYQKEEDEDCQFVLHEKETQIKLISAELVETANKFTGRDLSADLTEVDFTCNKNDDDDSDMFSYKVSKLVESLEKSCSPTPTIPSITGNLKPQNHQFEHTEESSQIEGFEDDSVNKVSNVVNIPLTLSGETSTGESIGRSDEMVTLESCSITEDSTVVSNGDKESYTQLAANIGMKKSKREKGISFMDWAMVERRVTRGTLVVPQMENIMWDDGGCVDLFQCDQCDYVGKQRVYHFVNFHAEREVPCYFRKEDFGPVLRDPLGPLNPIELGKIKKLNLMKLPKKMVFDTEIKCKEKDCDYISNNRFDFIYHLLEHNPDALPTMSHCRLCNFMSDDLDHFYDHVTSHTGEYRYTCIRCYQKAYSLESLKSHHKDYHGSQSQLFETENMILEDGWPYIHACKSCHYVQIEKKRADLHVVSKHNGRADIVKTNMSRLVVIHKDRKKESESPINKGQNFPEGESNALKKGRSKSKKGSRKIRQNQKKEGPNVFDVTTSLEGSSEKEEVEFDSFSTEDVEDEAAQPVDEQENLLSCTDLLKQANTIPVFLGQDDQEKDVENNMEQLVSRILLNKYTIKSPFDIKKKTSLLDDILKKVDRTTDNDNEDGNDSIEEIYSTMDKIDKPKKAEKVTLPVKDEKETILDSLKPKDDKHENEIEAVINLSLPLKDDKEVVKMPSDLGGDVKTTELEKNEPSLRNTETTTKSFSQSSPGKMQLTNLISRLQCKLSEGSQVGNQKEMAEPSKGQDDNDGDDSDSEGNLVICEDRAETENEDSPSQTKIESVNFSRGLTIKPLNQLVQPSQPTRYSCTILGCKIISKSKIDSSCHMWEAHKLFLCMQPFCKFVTQSEILFNMHFISTHKVVKFPQCLNCSFVATTASTLLYHLSMPGHIAIPDESTPDPMDEEVGGEQFLKIESCRTLDPTTASQLFSSDESMSLPTTVSPTTPLILVPRFGAPSFPPMRKLAPKPIFPPCLATVVHRPSIIFSTQVTSRRISEEMEAFGKKSQPSYHDIPGGDTLPSNPPTVPLKSLFLLYNTEPAFKAYTSTNASEVFKCMVSGCLFVANSGDVFTTHLRSSHNEAELRCCYCLVKLTSAKTLTDHIISEHSHCEIQCKYCLYRTYSKVYLGTHLKKFHPDFEPRYIKVTTVNLKPPPNPPTINFVHYYKCSLGNCSFQAVDSEPFKTHVSSHGSHVVLQCQFCDESAQVDALVKHMQTHMMNEFQCPFCLYGEGEREKLLNHLLNCHPSRPGKVLLRKQESSTPPGTTRPPSILAGPLQTSSPAAAPRKIPVTNIGPVDGPTFLTQAESAVQPQRFNIGLTPLRTEGERSGSSLNIAGESTNVKPVESKGYIQDKEVLQRNFCTLKETGLVGCTLYRCGNERCHYACETQLILKEHLQVCDFSRDSPLLRCFHCSRCFRHLNALLDHIKVHGPKRYMCGVEGCNYRASGALSFRNHMKQVHHKNSYRIVQKDFSNKNVETQEFIMYPKDSGSAIREPHKKKRNEYSIEDMEKIPRFPISSQEMKCYHCMFSTKVRLNLIRHLTLHKKPGMQKIIPSKQPTNPVPRLESKGLMFDKMMNLAGSSIDNKRRVEENELRNKYPIPITEFDQIPIYIPEEKLNLCPFRDCEYLSCDETMLKCHIKTLHSEMETFECPHLCNFKFFTLDDLSNHFKLHGERLYRCGWCSHLAIRLALIDRHMTVVHPDKPPFHFTLRDLENKDAEGTEIIPEASLQDGSKTANASSVPILKANFSEDSSLHEKYVEPSEPKWQCGNCTFKFMTQQEVVNHCSLKHDVKSQYKCGYCSMKSNMRSAFDIHFTAKHPGKEFKVLCMYYRLDSVDIEPIRNSGGITSHEPLWKRNDPERKRQIRGILLETENELEPSVFDIEPGNPKGEEFVCPKCHSFKTPCVNTFRSHLCKEANYQRFECAECGAMNPLLPSLRRHFIKVHGAHFSSDSYITLPVESTMEAWVESIISHQQHMIRSHYESEESSKSSSNLRSSNDKEEIAASVAGETTSGALSTNDSGGDKGKLVCKICGLECKSATGLKSHKAVNHPARFRCQYCSFSSNSTAGMKIHMHMKHPRLQQGSNRSETVSSESVKHECSRCHFTTNNSRAFYIHWQSHSHPLDYVCEYCGERFADRARANKHSCTKHRSQPAKIVHSPVVVKDGQLNTEAEKVKNEISGDPSQSSGNGRNTIVTEPIKAAVTYICCHCSNRGSFANIEEHLKAQHRDLPFLVKKDDGNSVFLEIYKYKCGHCPTESGALMEAMNHWLTHHVALDFKFSLDLEKSSKINGSQVVPQNSNSVVVSPTSVVGVTPEKPDSTSKLETTQSDSEAELVSSTSEEKEVIAKCGYCRKTSSKKMEIQEHILSAHGGKPMKMHTYAKEEYDKKFKGMFECSYCSASGSTMEMQRHSIEIHPNMVANFKRIVRPQQNDKICFRCELCFNVVKTHKAIRSHMDKIHPNDVNKYTKLEFGSPLRQPGKLAMKCHYCGDMKSTLQEMQTHHTFTHSHLPLSYANLMEEALISIHKSSVGSPERSCQVSPRIPTSSASLDSLPLPDKSDPSSALQVIPLKQTARKSFPSSSRTWLATLPKVRRQVASKSTSGRLKLLMARSDRHSESSHYKVDQPNLDENQIYANVSLLGGVPMRLTATQLADLIDLRPKLQLEDISPSASLT